MKKRNGFVSNSSSSSFIITNTTDKDLSFVDFVKENPHLVKGFIEWYDWYNESDYNQKTIIASAENYNQIIPANSSDEYEFGDHDGVLETVLHTMLQNDGESKSFKWGDYESHH